jgi:hypothetical protein
VDDRPKQFAQLERQVVAGVGHGEVVGVGEVTDGVELVSIPGHAVPWVRLAVLVLVGWYHCLARGEAAKLVSVIAWRMRSRVGGSSMLSAARALPAAGFGLSLDETETWLNNVRAA